MKIEGEDIATLLRLLAVARMDAQEFSESLEADDWEVVTFCGEEFSDSASSLIGFLTRKMHDPKSWI